MAPVHAGSWFGLPDFGITEAIGGYLGTNNTQQGGSNLSGSLSSLVTAPSNLQTNQNTYNTQMEQVSQQNPINKIPTATTPTNTSNVSNPGPQAPAGAPPYASNVENQTVSYNGQTFKSDGKGGWVLQAGPSAAELAAAAELQGLNDTYDYNRQNLLSQQDQLGTSRQNSLSSLDTQYGGISKDVAQQKLLSQQGLEKNIADAASTAQSVQRQNRNTLRALGILGSTASGELLNKPMNEFDKQRASFVQDNTNRIAQLDNFMNQKTAEHADAVKQIETQYTNLIDGIQRDLRFNDRQRATAIQQANAAVQQRIAEVQAQQTAYAQQVNTMKQNLAAQLYTIKAQQNPNFDPQTILSQAFDGNSTINNAKTASIYDPTKKNSLSTFA